ncbi:unnamed protein product [Rodentolepis nana]|uniref:Transmembrane protein n=1 Tax=Rodentolepis nana TaxID=102285 RepID=A0A0R3TV75_RODNA|nr:unnamed protein product [Rodentolepis nana]
MDHLFGFAILALAGSLIFFFATGFPAWPCSNNLFQGECTKDFEFREIGILFIVVGLLAFFTALLLIHFGVTRIEWAAWSALVFSGIVAALALGSIIFYVTKRDPASPYVSGVAAGLSVGLFVLLVIEYTE